MAINSLKKVTGTPSVDAYRLLKSPSEVWVISAAAATGTVNVDVKAQGVLYYTVAASANFTLNFRADSANTLSSMLDIGQAVTVVFINTNGTTPYYASAFQIDGTVVTPKWLNGSAPTAGTASSADTYTFTIVKTAATPTYTILASLAPYA